jgi:hypothetical protein
MERKYLHIDNVNMISKGQSYLQQRQVQVFVIKSNTLDHSFLAITYMYLMSIALDYSSMNYNEKPQFIICAKEVENSKAHAIKS